MRITLRKDLIPILLPQDAAAENWLTMGQLAANAAEVFFYEFDDLPSREVYAEIIDLLREIDVE